MGIKEDLILRPASGLVALCDQRRCKIRYLPLLPKPPQPRDVIIWQAPGSIIQRNIANF